jgi:pyruvate dehydrogenase E1 component alpha subunit
MLEADARETIDAEIEAAIAEAVDFAEQSPWPEPEELFSHVYAD